MACTRQAAPRPTCKPYERVAYCNASASSTKPRRNNRSAGAANGTVACGIVLSGAILPEAIAAGQVTASATSVPYADFHGTDDTVVPYRFGPHVGRCPRHEDVAGRARCSESARVHTRSRARPFWGDPAVRSPCFRVQQRVFQHQLFRVLARGSAP